MHSPPSQTRERLMKAVGREKKARPTNLLPMSGFARGEEDAALPALDLLEEEPKRSFAARALPWAGWAVAALFIIEAGALYQDREQLRLDIAADRARVQKLSAEAERANTLLEAFKDPVATRVTLTTTAEKPEPQGRATYLAGKGALVFLATNLEPLQAYKTYELWLIPTDGRDPIAAGTFQPDAHGNASVILPELPKGIEAKAFGVTIEDMGGAASPTMPIILKGQAS
jgi:hypothetical protein